ncbi:MAG: response regulator transcription factor [Polaromonas sp.]|nr:response regulator transcription factor [Polaromonas sp.]
MIGNDARAADLVSLLLQAEGFAVLLAGSAGDALAMARHQALSLIMLDVDIPGDIDAWEFLLRIREIKTLANVPVVIISDPDDHHMALTRGATAVLQRPISRAQLTFSLANLGLHPAQEPTQTMLIVDDEPKAVEVIAASGKANNGQNINH